MVYILSHFPSIDSIHNSVLSGIFAIFFEFNPGPSIRSSPAFVETKYLSNFSNPSPVTFILPFL